MTERWMLISARQQVSDVDWTQIHQAAAGWRPGLQKRHTSGNR